jgi:hypothetical protein
LANTSPTATTRHDSPSHLSHADTSFDDALTTPIRSVPVRRHPTRSLTTKTRNSPQTTSSLLGRRLVPSRTERRYKTLKLRRLEPVVPERRSWAIFICSRATTGDRLNHRAASLSTTRIARSLRNPKIPHFAPPCAHRERKVDSNLQNCDRSTWSLRLIASDGDFWR